MPQLPYTQSTPYTDAMRYKHHTRTENVEVEAGYLTEIIMAAILLAEDIDGNCARLSSLHALLNVIHHRADELETRLAERAD